MALGALGLAVDAALAPASKTMYEGVLRRFGAWHLLTRQRMPAFPAELEPIAEFAAFLLAVKAPSLWPRFQAALKFAHNVRGHEDVLSRSPAARWLSQGMHRLMPASRRRVVEREPVLPTQVRAIVRQLLPHADNEALPAMHMAVFVCTLYALFGRFSEVAGLRVKDVSVHPTEVCFTFSSKTSRRRGAQERVCCSSAGDEFLPLVRLWGCLYTRALNALPPDQLIFADFPQLRTAASFGSWLQKVTGQSSLLSHSFRAGAVGLALAVGLDLTRIKLLGRWASLSSLERCYVTKAAPHVPLILPALTRDGVSKTAVLQFLRSS